MRKILLLITGSAISIAALPIDIPLRSFPGSIHDSRDRISRERFLKSRINRARTRFILPTGWPEHITDIVVDLLPIDTRILVMKRLLGTDGFYGNKYRLRRQIHVEMENLPINSAERIYLHYLLGSMYMEAGLIEPFFALGYAHYDPVVDGIHNCTEFLARMSERFQVYYNYPLNHVTPRMVHDWFELLAKTKILRFEAPTEYANDRNGGSIPQLELISLELNPWLATIENRLHRLTLTGYENIDL